MEKTIDPIATLYHNEIYASGASTLFEWLRAEDRRILDVGCGSGGAALLLRDQGVEVHGLTVSGEERRRAAATMERAWLANVETWEPDYHPGFFDAFVFSHVLEHLVDPLGTLRRLTVLLRPGGRVYIAVPNIAYWRYRLRLLRGRFDYESRGTMDRRHLRFFTLDTARELVEQVGLDCLRLEPCGHVPLGWVRRALPRVARCVDRWALRHFGNLFGYEILLVATKRVD